MKKLKTELKLSIIRVYM